MAGHMNHSTNWSSSDVGGLCWVSDPAQAYIEAKVTSVGGGRVTAASNDGRDFDVDLELPLKPPSRKQKEAPRRVLQRVPLTSNNGASARVPGTGNARVTRSYVGVDNMDNLSTLHEAAILDNIQHRFRMDLIYTNTGPILIAMNPFKWLPIYGDDVIGRYHGRPYGALPPHCYQEAEDAFTSLQRTRKNQAIVICGESGAGKTETTKLMLHYLSVASKRTSARRESGAEQGAGGPTIAERMVASNPLLEAFGNAKTLRNDNSSRFGKFTRFDFAMNSAVINGGHIENLLLEKVRVVEQAPGERNYHVFYQLCRGAAKGLLEGAAGMGLAGAALEPASHGYSSGCADVAHLDDAEEFQATVAALDALGVRSDERERIFRVAAAVAWLGDVHFVEAADDGSAVAPGDKALAQAATLLGVDAAKLAAALVVRVREIHGGETVTSLNDVKAAAGLRDALAKATFSRLFDWLVSRANAAFDVSGGKETQFIGVLDIFGFEDMQSNGFEQVFINTTNEMLQKVFNDIIFKSEEEEYTREQIDWDKTVFPDNTPCIELLSKRPNGILRLLDGECLRGNAASDGAKFAAKVNKAHGGSPFFEVCGPASVWRRNDGTRTSEEDFLVHHFAGPIVYTVSNFVDKNRDALFGHVYDVLAGSSAPVVAACFPPRPAAEAAAKMTVANKYLGQLNALVNVLRESSSRFVRCIKTNEDKLPAKLDKPSVLRQLVCSGVMAALEVRRAGFPTRVLYREFVRDFRAFTPRGAALVDPKAFAAAMMKHPHVAEAVPASAYRLGVSKLFMQSEVLYKLQSIKNAMLYPFVRRLQRWWIKLQGSILQRKLKRCQHVVANAKTEASIKGVAAVEYVLNALAAAAAAGDGAAAAVGAGKAGPAAEAIAAFRTAADRCASVVEAAVKQKEEAYRIRAELLSEIDGANERCGALKTTANELYDPADSKALLAVAAGAEKALAECRVELLTVANSWDRGTLAMSMSQGPHTLRRAGTMASMANLIAQPAETSAEQRRRRLDGALKAVRDGELAAAAYLEKKRRMDEARAEFQASLDLASERLGAIQVDVFIIAGIRTVSDAVVGARDAIFAAQKALQAVDPGPCKAAVADATRAVEAALATAQREAARVAALVTLDESEKCLAEIAYQAQDAGFENRMADSSALAEAAIATARGACAYPDVHVLQQSTQRAVDAVNACGELLEREIARKKAEEKARFNKLLGRFQKMDEQNSGGALPNFARQGSKNAKPLFKVRRVAEQTEDVSGVGPSSDVAPASPAPARKKALAFAATPPPPAPPATPAAPPFSAGGEPPETPYTPGPPPPPTPAGGHTLETWIAAKNLGKYEAQLLDLAGDLHDLVEMTDDDAAELIAECKMPKLAARRFKKALIELGASVAP